MRRLEPSPTQSVLAFVRLCPYDGYNPHPKFCSSYYALNPDLLTNAIVEFDSLSSHLQMVSSHCESTSDPTFLAISCCRICCPPPRGGGGGYPHNHPKSTHCQQAVVVTLTTIGLPSETRYASFLSCQTSPLFLAGSVRVHPRAAEQVAQVCDGLQPATPAGVPPPLPQAQHCKVQQSPLFILLPS